jgi:ABC-2 type transport system permease protein
MSIYTVARDDFRNLTGSYLILGILTTFVAMVAFVFISEINVYPDPFRALFDVSNAVILLGPVLLAPVAYQSIVGDRTSGRIKFSMGLPNSRGEYFAGKVLSRFAVVTVATVGSVMVGFVIAVVTFTNPPDPGRFAIFAGTTLLYTLSFTSIFIALSALAESRATAMFASLAAYFVLVLFVLGVAPYLNLETLLAAIGDLLGTPISDSMERFIQNLTPYPAYGGATHPIYADVLDQYQRLPSPPPSELNNVYAKTWFDVSILSAWVVVPLILGFLKFRTSELQ